ncbi:MAG: DNA polymerase III subunit delta [Acidobacteriota bacterium]
MQHGEFLKHLESGPLAPVYLFLGEAELLMDEAWRQMVERLVPAQARRFNGERLYAREVEADQIVARLGTMSMFGPKLVLMVQNIEAWPKDQRNILQKYLSRPNPSSCLVMTASQKKGLEKIIADVEHVGKVVLFTSPGEREAPRWVQERAPLHGKRIAPGAAAILVDLVGNDLYRLERELEKLAAYTGDRERIEADDVRQLVSGQKSHTVFELVRLIGLKEPAQAVSILRSLLVAGDEPLRILAMLARQVRMIWQVKDGLDRGMSLADIGKRMNLQSFILKNYTQQAAGFSQAELRRMHEAIRKTDLALKSTGPAPGLVLEGLVLDLCHHGTQKSP